MPRKSRTQTGLVAWLTETTCPVFLIDSRRRVRFFNRGCVELTGCQPADVIGKPCDYLSDPLAGLSERILHAIAPPAEVLAGQELFTTIDFIDARGEAHRQSVLYVPLPGSESAVPVVLGIMLTRNEAPRILQPTPAQHWHAELAQLLNQQSSQYQLSALIARSPAMQRVREQIQLASGARLPVHITGPVGCGKMFVARVLQTQLPRPVPWIPLECRSLPRTEQRRLLKDVLTNFRENREPAGVLIRDIDLLAEDLQVWLAEVFSDNAWPTSLRLVSTSRESLQQLTEEDRFSAGLFFAATPMIIQVPGLQARREDFDLLVQYFIEQGNPHRESQLTGIEPSALDELRRYDWKGNVAELRQLLEEALPGCAGPLLQSEQLPFRWQTGRLAQSAVPLPADPFEPLEQVLERLERQEIARALQHARNNKAKAAELLGLTRPKLYRRLEQLGLPTTDAPPPSE